MPSAGERDGANLVEERERAGVALEGVRTKSRRAASTSRSTSAARRRAAMASMSRRWYALSSFSASSDRPARSCGGPGTALAQDAAERRHPAEPLVRLEHPVALDAAIDLGARRRARRAGASRTSGRRGPGPSRRRAARRPGAAARTGARRRGAPRASGPRARRCTRRSRRTRASRAGSARHGRRWTWVTTSNVRPRASATFSSANGSRLPPSRDVGRRMPLAIALSLPPPGVMSVRTRSASPRSKRDRTIASVV